MINLVFEDTENFLNLFDETEVLDDKMFRICKSPYADNLVTLSKYYNKLNKERGIVEFFGKEYQIKIHDANEIVDGKYIIPVGVNQSPKEWIGSGYLGMETDYKWKNIFDKLSYKFRRDLQKGKAFLMIDNSLEGYHHDSIFDYIYQSAVDRFINPKQVIYVTGNAIIEDRLKIWKDANRGKETMRVVPYLHFEYDIGQKVNNIIRENPEELPSFKEHLQHKEAYEWKIKIFNFLNKKPRKHRFWFFQMLNFWGLIHRGVISMNKLNIEEPLNIDYNTMDIKDVKEANKELPIHAYDISNEIEPFDYYMYNFNKQAALDSYFSVISETHYEDEDGTCFISEKTFKAIANKQPFIILGNRNSLKKLKELGYKTFDSILDETYDDLESIHRMNAIIQEIREWEAREDKITHFKWSEAIVEHNFRVLVYNSLFNPPPYFYKLNKLLNENAE